MLQLLAAQPQIYAYAKRLLHWQLVVSRPVATLAGLNEAFSAQSVRSGIVRE